MTTVPARLTWELGGGFVKMCHMSFYLKNYGNSLPG